MLDYRGADQAARELGCRIQEGEPLAPRTTFRIGGPADRLYTLENLGQLKGLLQALEQGSAPYALLKVLRRGFLDGVTGIYHTPRGYDIDEHAAEAYDLRFPPKEKLRLPGQLF